VASTFTSVFRSLGRGFVYYPALVELAGSVNACIVLSLLISWQGKGKDPDGWIYKTQVEMEAETGLKKDAQQAARKELKRRGYIEEKYADNPRRLYYRLRNAAINAAWEARFTKNGQNPEQHQHNAESTATRSGNSLPQEAANDRFSVYTKRNNKKMTTTRADVVVSSTDELEKTATDSDPFAAVRSYVGQYPELVNRYGRDTLLRALLITQKDGRDLSPQNGAGRYIRGVCRNGAVIPPDTKHEPPIDPARREVLARLHEGTRIVIQETECQWAEPGIMVDGRMVPRSMMADLILSGQAKFLEEDANDSGCN